MERTQQSNHASTLLRGPRNELAAGSPAEEGGEGHRRRPQGGCEDISLLLSDHQAGLWQRQHSLLEETEAKQQCCERMVGSCLPHEYNRLREKDAAVN